MTLIADFFSKLRTPENIDIYPKSPVSKDPLTGNMGNQTLLRSGQSTATIFTDHFEGNFEKSRF